MDIDQSGTFHHRVRRHQATLQLSKQTFIHFVPIILHRHRHKAFILRKTKADQPIGALFLQTVVISILEQRLQCEPGGRG